MKVLFLACLLAIFFPGVAYAAQTSRTLQPGNTYEFIGVDARVISNVNVTGTGRYQIVAWDEDGEVTRFGMAGGRVSVGGVGGVHITPGQAMTVSFDSSRLRFRQLSGTALRRFELQPGRTLTFENSHGEGLNIRTSQGSVYSYAVFNRIGAATRFSSEQRLPQFSIPANTSVAITPVGQPMEIYFPTLWYGREITVTASGTPPLAIIELLAGQVYEIVNDGNTSRTLNLESDEGGISFDYIVRGADGHVIRYGSQLAETLQVLTNQTMAITPQGDGKLVFPQIWVEDIGINQSTATPAMFQELAPGQTLTITNNEALRTHRVFITNPDAGYDFSFDYVLQNEDDVSFGTREIVADDRSEFFLRGGSSVTITALDEVLAINIPQVDTLNTRLGATSALTRHELNPGESMMLENSGDSNIWLLTTSEDSANIDYLRRYMPSEEIISFGRTQANSASNMPASDTARAGANAFRLPGNESAHITNVSDEVITLHFSEIDELSITTTSRQALFRRQLTQGQAVQVTNVDRHYNHSFQIVNESRRSPGQTRVFEYVRYSNRENIASFGEAPIGEMEVRSGGRVNLMPLDSSHFDISIVFPREWERYLSVTTWNEAPLHRITLIPGQRTTITNNLSRSFTMRNNTSPTSAAGYFLHILPPAELEQYPWVTCPDTGETIYLDVTTREPIYRGSEDEPIYGPITLSPRHEVTIFATVGADLELWLPMRWARMLRLVR
ncbi:MAG: hypothetical protein FWC78_02945 [Defluviitaleaceae bacterium]|nr:hypothetical protein [Defluviitaleaceae bacterium]